MTLQHGGALQTGRQQAGWMPKQARVRAPSPEERDEGLWICYRPEWMLVVHKDTGQCSKVRMVTGRQGNP